MNKELISKAGAAVFAVACVAAVCSAQVNSGSKGSDGAFNPTTNVVINMADHPNGIYQYTSVMVSNGVTVSFVPNAENTPVVWLVQSNVVISGTVDVSGQFGSAGSAGVGGPGGYRGGNSGANATAGQGPGGGVAGGSNYYGGMASFGTLGSTNIYGGSTGSPGAIYGNNYLIPLLGGSGGGGGGTGQLGDGGTGGGGGGAILIASSGTIQFIAGGLVRANAGLGSNTGGTASGGTGSGGAVRLVASTITGSGYISAVGSYWGGGDGRVRFDTYANNYSGGILGVFTQGSQFTIIPTPGQGAQLMISSIAGVAVSASPSGVLSVPDAVLSAQQANPIPVVVTCANIPLNTAITVSVRPANGSTVTAVGHNTTGTQAGSTATVLVNVPRGGGIIWATAATSN